MAELFRSEKTREHLLKVAADYENMSDQAAMFELQDADRERLTLFHWRSGSCAGLRSFHRQPELLRALWGF